MSKVREFQRVNNMRVLWFMVLVFYSPSYQWENFELEVFDVYEEVNSNFYEFMGVPQDAPSSDIKKAYRKLSLQLHPDKNDAADADVQFRNLVSIYDVLREEKKRACYDRVLVEGLPNWRNPLYYYRRYRKMGTMETSLWLIVLTSIIQYAVYVAAYWEKKFEIREVLGSRIKKQKKQSRKKQVQQVEDEVDIIEEEINQLPKPSVWDLLPFQFCRLFIFVVKTIPTLPGKYGEHVAEKKRIEAEARELAIKEEEERLEEEKEENERKQRRKKTYKLEERVYDDTQVQSNGPQSDSTPDTKPAPVITGGFWTDDDISELARLMKKFPPGIQGRWEKVAEMMNRSVPEVTKMSYKLKDGGYRSAPSAFKPVVGTNEPEDQEENESEPVAIEVKKKVKTKGGKFAEEATSNPAALDANWSQKQQRALEVALTQFPKGSLERWERVAKVVPGKTMEECMLRVRYLAEKVRKRKEEEEKKSAEMESLDSQSQVDCELSASQ